MEALALEKYNNSNSPKLSGSNSSSSKNESPGLMKYTEQGETSLR